MPVINFPRLPHQLQFRLWRFLEHKSTDSFLQGADDEVYMSALGVDSATIVKAANGSVETPQYIAPLIGDVSSDPVRRPWSSNPFVLVDWDLTATPKGFQYPRTFTVVLLVVEHDNDDVARVYNKVIDKVGGKIREEVVKSATSAGTALVNVVVGSAIPGVGAAIGSALGGLAGLGFDAVVAEIRAGLQDDVFTPIPLTFTSPRRRTWVGTKEQSLHIQQFGAHYELGYDWHYAY